MTVTAPPRPPGPTDPVERNEPEALIEEARRRARRRRRLYVAGAAVVALGGAALFAFLERGGGSQSAPGRVAGRSSAAAAAADSTIFFVRAPASPPGPSALYAVGPDGRGERLLARNAGGYAWSRDRQKLAFVSGRLDAPRVVAPIPVPPGNGNLDIYAMNVDGSGRQRLTRTPAARTRLTGRPTGGNSSSSGGPAPGTRSRFT